MRNVNDEVINDVFSRINTYGHRLSNQERKNKQEFKLIFLIQFEKLVLTFRGDSSTDVLPLKRMPEISIDLPRSKYWLRRCKLKKPFG